VRLYVRNTPAREEPTYIETQARSCPGWRIPRPVLMIPAHSLSRGTYASWMFCTDLGTRMAMWNRSALCEDRSSSTRISVHFFYVCTCELYASEHGASSSSNPVREPNHQDSRNRFAKIIKYQLGMGGLPIHESKPCPERSSSIGGPSACSTPIPQFKLTQK